MNCLLKRTRKHRDVKIYSYYAPGIHKGIQHTVEQENERKEKPCTARNEQENMKKDVAGRSENQEAPPISARLKGG